MRPFPMLLFLAFFFLLKPALLAAEDIMVEDFEVQPETRWNFFTDRVMGGVSSGQLSFVREDGRVHAHMTGNVSTANNGGFIQMRMDLEAPPPQFAKGVRLVVRGNEQQYFAHLRTNGTVLPWQYYQAGFEVSGDWTEIRLPFEAFERSGRLLRAALRPESLTSIGIVAYGRDHDAEIDVRAVGFY